MASNHLFSVAGQAELALSRRPTAADVPIEIVRAQKTSGAAFSLSCQASGLQDNEIYLGLGIDAGYFSRIKKGDATLQGDLIAEFCEVVGNKVYPEWLAYQVGCTLVMIQTEAERRAAEAEQALAEEQAKVRLLTQILNGKAA